MKLITLSGVIMFAFICFLINVYILIFCIHNNKNITHPIVLLNSMWLFVNFLNTVFGWNSNEIEYLILSLPSLMFSIGFYFSENVSFKTKINVSNKARSHNYFQPYKMKNYFSSICLIIVCIAFLFHAYSIVSRLGLYGAANIWLEMRYMYWDTDFHSFFALKYIGLAAFLLPSVMLISAQRSREKSEWIKFLVAFVVAVLWSLTATSRTATFTVVMVLAMSQVLLIGSFNNFSYVVNTWKNRKGLKRKETKYIVLAMVSVLTIFIFVASLKYAKNFESMSLFQFIFSNILSYTNLSSAAFVEWYKQGFSYTYGYNSFRFLNAIIARLGGNYTEVAVNFGGEFVNYEGMMTNALTVAKPYVEDFGIIYMACLLCVFGIIHGAVYKSAVHSVGLNKIRFSLFNAILMIPLFYQILTNQYLNVLSGWLQFIFWSIFFTKFCFWKCKENLKGN